MTGSGDAPQIMGILNTTPDSFSDGGLFIDSSAALDHAREMWADGASWIDVGGESTRPGAAEVSEAEELNRVVDLVGRISAEGMAVSIDTSKPQVMLEAVAAGARMINDVYALRRSGALEAAAQTDVQVCLMHMQGEPRTMQSSPDYADVVVEVRDFLNSRILACEAAGIERSRLLIDPGFGFGKSLAHNMTLLANLEDFGLDDVRLLIGVSRKSMFGQLLGRGLDERVAGGLAAAMIAAQSGASVIRTHDVRETTDVLAVLAAVQSASQT